MIQQKFLTLQFVPWFFKYNSRIILNPKRLSNYTLEVKKRCRDRFNEDSKTLRFNFPQPICWTQPEENCKNQSINTERREFLCPMSQNFIFQERVRNFIEAWVISSE